MNNINLETNSQKCFSIKPLNFKDTKGKSKHLQTYNRSYYLKKKNKRYIDYLNYYHDNKLQIKQYKLANQAKLPSVYNRVLIDTFIDFS